MNCVVIYAEEIAHDGSVLVTGSRAQYFIEQHRFVAGITVRAAIFEKTLGYIRVFAVDAERLEVKAEISCEEEPPARLAIDLLVAVPRPQTIKKLLHLAASTGIRSLIFFGGDRGDKSYLQSKMLKPEAIHNELILGIEQACDARIPTVEVVRSLDAWVRRSNCNVSDGQSGLLVADTVCATSFRDAAAHLSSCTKFTIAVGCESGWSDREREVLNHLGFTAVSLGARMLRVELAAHSLITQAAYLIR